LLLPPRLCKTAARPLGGNKMRHFDFLIFSILGLSILTAMTPLHAQDGALIPERRLVLSQDVDLPGGDIASIFDTTLNACESACLANTTCTAFTFNAKANACFIKANPGEPAAFSPAWSGTILTAKSAAQDLAQLRFGDLNFLSPYDFDSAVTQANDMGNAYVTNTWTAEEHMASAVSAESNGNYDVAFRFAGAAINLLDSAYDWAEFARLVLLASERDTANQSNFRNLAFSGAINAYLRAEDLGLRHNILITLGDAAEKIGRGRDKVQALRLAQALQPRDDTALALDDAMGKYGFRIQANEVESDSARPRICVTFTERLVASGVDYSTFVQLPEPGLTVSNDGYRQLCVEGVEHGQRYALTFREGLPAADGQTLAKSITVSGYLRDRSPSVRLAARGYVLPALGGATLPIETVNTDKLELTLYRVTDRNLLRSLQNGYFGSSLQDYETYDFSSEIGTQIWSGTAEVKNDINRDVTTRLPMDEALKGQASGIYVLRASVPGADPYNNPAAWQWFAVSDLGMTTLSGVDGLHVFVRSLGTAAAKAGVEVELLSTANEVLGTATTDARGYVMFVAGLTRGTGSAAPAMVVARDGEADLGFLSLTDPEFDLSDRGVEGRQAAPPVDVFLTTDRGAYRAGETIFATALARDADARAIEGLPLTAILSRPDGVEYSRQLIDDQGAGGHVFAMPVGGSAPRGPWTLTILADAKGDTLARQTILVEDFLPERIDFTLSLDQGDIALTDAPTLTIDARYLFGAPGADMAVEGEVRLSQDSSVKGWEGYAFGRYDGGFSSVTDSLETTRTDATGQAVIDLALPFVEDPGVPLQMQATLRVSEGSGRPVERQISKPISPAAPMIGIKPLFESVAAEGKDARFDLIAVGTDLKPISMQVKWVLTRIQTDYQWYSRDGNWNWQPLITRSPVAQGDAMLGDAPLEISSPVQWGRYELLVERMGGAPAASSVTFYAGWYAPADTESTPDTLELSLDKPAYAPGETAMLRLVPRAAGTALISVLSNHLVSMLAVEVAEGENLIELPVTDAWGAGVYVTASVLRPMDLAAGRNPTRTLGLAYAQIAPGDRALTATIQAPAEADPRGALDVVVKVDGVVPGQKAWVTLAAVDVGILNLTAFAAPDPSAYYFGQRKLGMGIRDIYGRLIDGMAGDMGFVRSGGDAAKQARLQTPPPTEELVAYFSGPIEVGADGMARVMFTLPSFNGTVKLMAVAWSAKGVGQASQDVLVRDPVVVTASLPRFLAPGDETRILLEIVHATGPSGRVSLDVTADASLTLGSVPSGVDLADLGKSVVEIPLTAAAEGIHKITVRLTTSDGKLLTKELTLPVMVNDPPVVRVSRFDLAKGQQFTFDASVFADLMPGSAHATLAVGTIARLNAPGVLQVLDAYPYGCTEQMTSKALPLLYFEDMARLMGLPGASDMGKRIEQAVAEILTNQDSSGAFGLWSPGSGDMWLDAYVTDFLSRARARGFAVPDQAFRQALDNLRNQVNYQPDFDEGGEALAYALMVLAREGAAAVGDLRYYADVKADAFSTPTGMAQLGAALASYGDQPRADAMFTRAARAVSNLPLADADQWFRYDYGTNRRDAAAVLALASEAGSRAVDAELLTTRITTNGPLSTQEATWTLLAANALVDGVAAKDITLNGVAADGPMVKVLDRDSRDPVLVRNNGVDTTLTVTTYGVPLAWEPAGGNGYAITRTYYTLEGVPASLDNLKTGNRLAVVLEVTPFGRGQARLMVSDPLPAGFEIDNPNLITGGSRDALDWLNLDTYATHTEFRQDRFLAAVDRFNNETFRLAYIVRAVSPGTFHHPAAFVEDMYRPDLAARSETGSVTIGH
jgi:uncharacterized protein YfaS (alpha-2-macroglobulin family)